MSNTPLSCGCLVFNTVTSFLVYWHRVADFLLCNWQMWCCQWCIQSICRTDASKVEGTTPHHWMWSGNFDLEPCNRPSTACRPWPKLCGHTLARSAHETMHLLVEMCLTLQLVPHLPEPHPPEPLQPLQPLQPPANPSSLEVTPLKRFQNNVFIQTLIIESGSWKKTHIHTNATLNCLACDDDDERTMIQLNVKILGEKCKIPNEQKCWLFSG